MHGLIRSDAPGGRTWKYEILTHSVTLDVEVALSNTKPPLDSCRPEGWYCWVMKNTLFQSCFSHPGQSMRSITLKKHRKKKKEKSEKFEQYWVCWFSLFSMVATGLCTVSLTWENHVFSLVWGILCAFPLLLDVFYTLTHFVLLHDGALWQTTERGCSCWLCSNKCSFPCRFNILKPDSVAWNPANNCATPGGETTAFKTQSPKSQKREAYNIN